MRGRAAPPNPGIYRYILYIYLDLLFPLHKETNTTHSTQLYTQVFYLISGEKRELICGTREGVFHLISKYGEVIHQTQEGVFRLISENPKSINPKSQKQYIKHEKSVSSDICKTPRSNISNTRSSVSSDN